MSLAINPNEEDSVLEFVDRELKSLNVQHENDLAAGDLRNRVDLRDAFVSRGRRQYISGFVPVDVLIRSADADWCTRWDALLEDDEYSPAALQDMIHLDLDCLHVLMLIHGKTEKLIEDVRYLRFIQAVEVPAV